MYAEMFSWKVRTVVIHFVKKIPVLWNIKFYRRVRQTSTLDPILSQLNPIHTNSNH
jgi:hypothetical protein